MNSKYVKPEVIVADGLSEGIYAASGSLCYSAQAQITQRPQLGRNDYRIQVDAKHSADHTSNSQIITIVFNQPITHSSGGTLVSQSGNTLKMEYKYFNNPNDNIGLNDIIVLSEQGLEIMGVYVDCN